MINKRCKRLAVVVFVYLLCGANLCVGASPDDPSIDELLMAFTSTDWEKVSKAECQLEERYRVSIPLFLELLDCTETAELTNTADLWYPGMKENHLFGPGVLHRINAIASRAAWAIQSITFQDFGFSRGGHFGAHYAGTKPFREATERAREWWTKNKETWTREKGLIAELQSGDENRQLAALHWALDYAIECSPDQETAPEWTRTDAFIEETAKTARSLSTSTDEYIRDGGLSWLDRLEYIRREREGKENEE